MTVPVLLLTGPTAVGKSTVLAACSELLGRADVPHAAVCLSDLGGLHPAPVDDEWNELVAHRNLAVVWRNFRAAGAERLLLERVLETRNLLRRIEEAVPGAEVTVVLLRAPLTVLRERIEVRNAVDPTWFLGVAEYLDGVFATAGVEDFAVDCAERPPSEVARELLVRAGWLS